MISQNEISALVSLLDDSDDFIFNEVKNKLLSLGNIAIPTLEEYWENNLLNITSQNRIENIIQEIQYDSIFTKLKAWKNKKDHTLLEGVLLINRYQYPDLDEKPIINKIDQIKRDVWIEINNNLTAFEKINVINQVLFDIYGFSGNKENYHSPQNSYISNVLETKKGNPLSLSIIYLLVTQELGLPIYGVNLPSHFILCYLDENNTNKYLGEKNTQGEPLLYINPFSRGTIFNKPDIEQFLKQIKLPIKQSYFEPCSTLNVITRVISNLIYSYEKLGYKNKVEDLRKLFNALK